MAVQTLQIKIPDHLFQRLQHLASESDRTVEDEALELLTSALPMAELPAEVAAALDAMDSFDDEHLWRSARGRLSPEEVTQIEDLHIKRQREGLSPSEKAILAGLIRRYEEVMVIRAKAVRLLHDRGHDVSPLRSAS